MPLAARQHHRLYTRTIGPPTPTHQHRWQRAQPRQPSVAATNPQTTSQVGATKQPNEARDCVSKDLGGLLGGQQGVGGIWTHNPTTTLSVKSTCVCFGALQRPTPVVAW